jgi:hypothetical protein
LKFFERDDLTQVAIAIYEPFEFGADATRRSCLEAHPVDVAVHALKVAQDPPGHASTLLRKERPVEAIRPLKSLRNIHVLARNRHRSGRVRGRSVAAAALDPALPPGLESWLRRRINSVKYAASVQVKHLAIESE